MASQKNGRMGWMAGKEHRSGPVIQPILPFFGFLPLPTLDQLPFKYWMRPLDLWHVFKNPYQSNEPIRSHFRLPSPYKSRLRHQPSHCMPCARLLYTMSYMKDEYTFDKVTFSTIRKMPIPFFTFSQDFRFPIFHSERVRHHQTVLPTPGYLERTWTAVPGSVDGFCSNGDGFRVIERVASFRLPSGKLVSHLPANDAVGENHCVGTCLPRGLFVGTRFVEQHVSVVQVPQTCGV
ncbi:hypothetical protein NPIL_610591 [Nephila pilipes]|uniref:Uncharacterized protein n=1 Tax=Nephila pilipes TaxID=299642 RepID=A0A8X6QTC6_NEPPI|nr:hypothetical protein NPIL_610591 [Nephila pilipes]